MWGGPGVPPKDTAPAPRHESLVALQQLLLQAKPEVDKGELAELSVTQLRDELLACNPLKADWVRQVNRVSPVKLPDTKSSAAKLKFSNPAKLLPDVAPWTALAG